MTSSFLSSLIVGFSLYSIAHGYCDDRTTTLSDSFGALLRHAGYESYPTETCRTTFEPTSDDEFILILKFNEFRAGQYDYVKLPDGRRLQRSQNSEDLGCMRYVRSNHSISDCLEKISFNFCPEETTQSKQWPPQLIATSKPRRINNNNKYYHWLKFNIVYLAVCQNKETVKFDVDTLAPTSGTIAWQESSMKPVKDEQIDGNDAIMNVIVGILSCIVLLCGIFIALLVIKLRKSKKAESHSRETDNNQLGRNTSYHRSSTNNHNQPESVASLPQCPTYSNFRESPTTTNRNLPEATTSNEDTYTVVQKKKVVSNVLYHSYNENNE